MNALVLSRRTTTGQAAALPSPAMDSRRRIRHLPRWIRGDYRGAGCKGTGSPPRPRGLPIALVKARAAEIAALKARIAELERRRGLNSSNSGKPPSSSDPTRP